MLAAVVVMSSISESRPSISHLILCITPPIILEPIQEHGRAAIVLRIDEALAEQTLFVKPALAAAPRPKDVPAQAEPDD